MRRIFSNLIEHISTQRRLLCFRSCSMFCDYDRNRMIQCTAVELITNILILIFSNFFTTFFLFFLNRLAPHSLQPAPPPMEFTVHQKCRVPSTCSRAFCMQPTNEILKRPIHTSTKRSKDTIASKLVAPWPPSNTCCCAKLCSVLPTMSIKLSAVNWWVAGLHVWPRNIFSDSHSHFHTYFAF